MLAWGLGTNEIVLMSVLGALLLGRRLPQMACSLARSIGRFGGTEGDGGAGSRVPREPGPGKPPSPLAISAELGNDRFAPGGSDTPERAGDLFL